jgi:hypothetical protein
MTVSRARSREGPLDRNANSASGASAVEFAIVLPLLLTLLFGVVEFGRGMAAYQEAVTASREAARFASVTGPVGSPNYKDCAGIVGAALSLDGLAALTAANVDISYVRGEDLAPISSACPPSDALQAGDRVVVTISRPFAPVFPAFGAFEISATDRRTIITRPAS